jgi:hypothetical protein
MPGKTHQKNVYGTRSYDGKLQPCCEECREMTRIFSAGKLLALLRKKCIPRAGIAQKLRALKHAMPHAWLTSERFEEDPDRDIATPG